MTEYVFAIRYNIYKLLKERGRPMSSLTDIQNKLTSLRDEVTHILHEINQLKMNQGSHIKTNLEEIYAKAKRTTRAQHDIADIELQYKEAYIELLLLVTDRYVEWNDSRLFAFYELLTSMNHFSPFEELIANKLILNSDQMFHHVELIKPYRYIFMLDALMIGYVDTPVSDQFATVLAGVATLLDINEEELSFIVQLSRCLLEQDEEAFMKLGETNTTKWQGVFINYIPTAWMEKSRVFCGSIDQPINSSILFRSLSLFFEVKKRVKHLEYVIKDEILFDGINNRGAITEAITITAVKTGFVYIVKKENTLYSYYIISCFDNPETIPSKMEMR